MKYQRIRKEAGKPRWDWVAPEPNTALINQVKALAEARIGDAYRITENKRVTNKLMQLKRTLSHN
ncbi:polynucleotide phosphorylase/polyadenylase [Actinobacillus equuli]|nr:polynucleotide phosphorylase/polyadenylase [Actinobacillus equuli]